MEYHTRVEGSYTIIELSGDVDLNYSPQARQQILKHLGNKSNVLIDLSKVAYIDSSGVASLVEGYQLAKKKNLNFGLVGVSQAAMQVLKLARLDRVFTIHNSVQEYLSDDA